MSVPRLAAVVLLCLGLSTPAWPYACPPRSRDLDASIADTPVIFTGRTLGATHRRGPDLRTTRFLVQESYKGGLRSGQRITLRSCIGHKCRGPFVRGKAYVVFAFRMEGDIYEMGACGWTRPLDDKSPSTPKLLAKLDALAAAGPGGVPRGLRRVAGHGYQGFVVERRDQGAWVPSDADVAAFEARVPASLAKALAAGRVRATRDLPTRLATYVRRYAGVTRDGHRLLAVRFFCAGHADLASQPPDRESMVRGGGECFVGAAYDTETKTIRRWSVNSPR